MWNLKIAPKMFENIKHSKIVPGEKTRLQKIIYVTSVLQ